MSSGVSLSLAGRVALVTGGSRGIGAATVRMFCQAGAQVVFSYRSATEQALALQNACGGPGICVAVQQELSTPEDGTRLVTAAVQAFGRLDCLVVNHGVWPAHDQPIGRMTDEQWQSTIGINLHSVFGLVRAGVAQMQQQLPLPDGANRHVVLVSSTAGQRGEAFHADYAASKGALISMTKGLATELASDRILVNCVAPGWVRTEMSGSTLDDPDTSNRVFRSIPLGRVATPDEIAGPILFLCTPLAGFVTGEVFNVNGGAVLVG